LAENSVDAIVTDPPYELGFMGKSWDASGVAFDLATWREALRVLKPGGHLIAFSGSRTYHRMAVAIEDAGFDIRDQIMWIYGSGFPKSLDVSKAIDKAAGAEREVVGTREVWGRGVDRFQDIGEEIPVNGNTGIPVTAPATTEAKAWAGWGTALKPAHEPIVLARKPLIGTVAENVLTYGTGGLNIDGGRVGNETIVTTNGKGFAGSFEGGENDNGGATHQGRWPANVIHDGSDEVVELFPDTKSGKPTDIRGTGGIWSDGNGIPIGPQYGDQGSAARFFYCAKASKKDRNEGLDGFEAKRRAGLKGADKDGDLDPVSERWRTEPCANHHPTVKPTTLMEYLCKLVTPPNGIVLDPFMGSGSTGKAAMYAGFNFIGIEMTEEYLPIAKARIEFAVSDNEWFLL